ncbi:MAG: HAH_0734 family protein [Haloarculaceae archaeon]
MKRLIIHGDPGIRKGAIINHDGEEKVCFSVSRQGDWHGPDRVQLWCTIGDADEQEAFERRQFIPMHLEVDTVDAETVDVVKAKGELAV